MGLIKYTMDSERRHSSEIRNDFYYDEADDRMILTKVQDVEPILKRNHRLRMDTDGYTKDRSMRHVATVPMVVIEKIISEQKWNPMLIENRQRLLQLLDTPDYAYLRTSKGRLTKKRLRDYFLPAILTKLVRG